MKQILTAALLFVIIVVVGTPAAIGQTAANNAQLEAEISKLLRDFYDALTRRDEAATMSVLADNGFFYSVESGYKSSVQIKEDFRSYLKAPLPANSKISFEIEDLKVISAGTDTALANYGIVTKSEQNGKTVVWRERYTNLFLRRDGRWLLFAEHSSRVPKPLELTVAGMPFGWIRTPANSSSRYLMTVDSNIKHGGKASAAIKFACADEDEFGSLAQSIAADDYRGKRVRFSGWLKTENAEAAGLWMRLDGNRRLLGFDNMMNRAVKGTTDWKQYEVVLDVPAEAVNIVFGTLVDGKGEVWVDDLKLEIVGSNVAVTNQLTPEQMRLDNPNRNPKKSDARQPVNLDFESGAIQ